MQEKKRRSKRGFLLLAALVALAVMAFVPAFASAAPSQLKPVIGDGFGAFTGVKGQTDHYWFPQFTSADLIHVNYTFTLNGVALGNPPANVKSVVFKVDGMPANGVVKGVFGSPQSVELNNWNALGMQKFSEGLHTVSSWVIETTPDVAIDKPIVSEMFGVDTVVPDWVHVVNLLPGADYTPLDGDEVFWNADKVDFSATVHDPAGSGVDATPTAAVPADGKIFEAVPLVWDEYIWDVTGTVSSPVGPDYLPVTKNVVFDAYDMVANFGRENYHVNFDRVAPSTSYTIDPLGANTQSGWTNKDVTLTFSSTDLLPEPNSGVAYTEYVVKTSDSHAVPAAPALTASGTQGTSVVITETAPIGPVYVYYRSVDKALPTPNYEAWKLAMVFIDKVAPALADDYPGWWMNTSFVVAITGGDHNSGIAAPGIEYMVSPLVAGHPTTWTVGGWASFDVMFGALTDGIFDLSYRATDKAGNSTLKVTKIKIDTRAPVTDGASGWINGLVPYVLTATDQVPGAGVAATVYRVDQATPWSFNLVNPVAPVVETAITIAGDHASFHTVDFASVDDARPARLGPR